MTSDDSIFVSNVVKNMKPLHYTSTKTHHGVVLVMVYEKYTLVETLVDGFVEDLVELTPKGLIVYPRESEWLLWYSSAIGLKGYAVILLGKLNWAMVFLFHTTTTTFGWGYATILCG